MLHCTLLNFRNFSSKHDKLIYIPFTTAAKSLSIELDDGFIDESRYSMFKAFHLSISKIKFCTNSALFLYFIFNTLSLNPLPTLTLSLSRWRALSLSSPIYTVSLLRYFVYVTAGEIFFIVLFENVTISPRIFVMNVDALELCYMYLCGTQFERLKVNAHTHHSTWILILCLSFIKYLFTFIVVKIIGGSTKFYKTIYWTLQYREENIQLFMIKYTQLKKINNTTTHKMYNRKRIMQRDAFRPHFFIFKFIGLNFQNVKYSTV